jgi:hypothetical protein
MRLGAREMFEIVRKGLRISHAADMDLKVE